MNQIVLVRYYAVECRPVFRSRFLIELAAICNAKGPESGTDQGAVGVPKPVMHRVVNERLQFAVACLARSGTK